MKKQIVIFLTFVVALMTACNETDPGPSIPLNPVTYPPPAYSMVPIIRSVYPSVGAPGTTISIFGENFGPTISHNYVTFDSISADITHIEYGVLTVQVPENLPDGEYTINLDAEGYRSSAPSIFKVTNGQH
jgi:hypothetical protein